jgi:cyclophilin family peptidyl-prolyl cis-trans isomerase
MPTDKRQRKRDGRLARIEAERAAAKVAARRRRILTAVIATVVVFAALVFISQTGGDDDDTAADDPTTSTTAEGDPAAAAASYGDTPCAPATAPAEPVRSFSSPFEDCLAEGVDYGATLTTEDGAFTIDLLEDEAPATVNNFVNLARSGFYDGSTFHRVLEDFVIQGGDPVGQPAGTGGPGYAVADELPEAGEYQVGSVAMANSGPDTQGSQFFVITGDQGVALQPQYTLFGTVTEGMDVVMTIEGKPGEPPEDPVVLTSVEVVETPPAG